MEPKRAEVELFWTKRCGWLSVAVVVLVSSVGYGLERILAFEGLSRNYMLALSNLLTGIAAGAVFLYVARHEKAHRELVRERVRTVAELNHHIRNALQVIKLCQAESDPGQSTRPLQLIKESADRIEWALREVLPKYPAIESARDRQPPVGYAAVAPRHELRAFVERRQTTRLRSAGR